MDMNEGAKRCCIRLGCGLRSDTLKNPYMDPDQLTTPQRVLDAPCCGSALASGGG